MLSWGFRQDYTKNHNKHQNLPGTNDQKVQALVDDMSLWGMRMFVKLREAGVPLKADVITRVCSIRLTIIFNDFGLSKRTINRQITATRKANMVAYAGAMEAIWGEELFPRPTAAKDSLGALMGACLQLLERGDSARERKRTERRRINVKTRDPRLIKLYGTVEKRLKKRAVMQPLSATNANEPERCMVSSYNEEDQEDNLKGD